MQKNKESPEKLTWANAKLDDLVREPLQISAEEDGYQYAFRRRAEVMEKPSGLTFIAVRGPPTTVGQQ